MIIGTEPGRKSGSFSISKKTERLSVSTGQKCRQSCYWTMKKRVYLIPSLNEVCFSLLHLPNVYILLFVLGMGFLHLLVLFPADTHVT